jgi:hypothetical protein
MGRHSATSNLKAAKSFIFLLFMVLALMDCATERIYEEKTVSDDQLVTLELNSFFTFTGINSQLHFTSVDGQEVSPFTTELKMLPGFHTVSFFQTKGYSRCPMYLSFDAEAGHKYQVRVSSGFFSGCKIRRWIEDKDSGVVVAGDIEIAQRSSCRGRSFQYAVCRANQLQRDSMYTVGWCMEHVVFQSTAWEWPRHDYVRAYAWYALAELNGHPTAHEDRAKIARKHLSEEEVAEAERLVTEWKPNPVECQIEAKAKASNTEPLVQEISRKLTACSDATVLEKPWVGRWVARKDKAILTFDIEEEVVRGRVESGDNEFPIFGKVGEDGAIDASIFGRRSWDRMNVRGDFPVLDISYPVGGQRSPAFQMLEGKTVRLCS